MCICWMRQYWLNRPSLLHAQSSTTNNSFLIIQKIIWEKWYYFSQPGYKTSIFCSIYYMMMIIEWIKLHGHHVLHAQSSTAKISMLTTQIRCERNDIIFLSLVIRLANFAPIYYMMNIVVQFHVNRKTTESQDEPNHTLDEIINPALK